MQRTSLMDAGIVVNFLAGVCCLFILFLPYRAIPVVYAGPWHVATLPNAPTWLSTWDEIRTVPMWGAPVTLAFLASWIMSGIALTQRKPLLKWCGLLGFVALTGLSWGVLFAGSHLLGFGAANVLGQGFWFSLAVMVCTGVGNLAVAAGATRLADKPSARS